MFLFHFSKGVEFFLEGEPPKNIPANKNKKEGLDEQKKKLRQKENGAHCDTFDYKVIVWVIPKKWTP